MKPEPSQIDQAGQKVVEPHSDDKYEIAAPVVGSRSIFTGIREIIIRHGDLDYKLRITKQNKLILTK